MISITIDDRDASRPEDIVSAEPSCPHHYSRNHDAVGAVAGLTNCHLIGYPGASPSQDVMFLKQRLRRWRLLNRRRRRSEACQ